MSGQVLAAIPPPEHPQYSYDPVPIQMEPPVGHNTMLHRYRCPKACKDSDFCVRRFPGYLHEDVDIAADRDEEIAWGIELVEGQNWAYLWVVGFLIAVCSIIFGVVWSVVMKDVQGGFTVAAYIASTGACLAGTVQVALEST